MRFLLNNIGGFLSRHVGQQKSNRVDVRSTLSTIVHQCCRMFKIVQACSYFHGCHVHQCCSTKVASCRRGFRRFGDVEMWMYRRMLMVPYVYSITNAEILRGVGEKRSLLLSVKRRKLKYFRHLTRAGGLQRLLLEGKVEGVRRRGAQRRT